MSQEASSHEQALARFYEIAPAGAPKPAFPEVIVRMHELWEAKLADASGASEFEKEQKAYWETVRALNEDGILQQTGLEMTPQEVRNALHVYFGVMK